MDSELDHSVMNWMIMSWLIMDSELDHSVL